MLSPKRTLVILESTERGVDRKFLEKLIESKIKNDYKQNIEFRHGDKNGSIEDVKKLLKTGLIEVTTRKFKNILIIVDADECPKSRFKELQDSLREREQCIQGRSDTGVIFNIPVNLKEIYSKNPDKMPVGIFLLPDNQNQGSLETLLLQALEYPQMADKNQCIERYFECLGSKNIDRINQITKNNKSKAQFRIFMATPNPAGSYVSNIIKHIDFNSQNFDPLIAFIKKAVNL